MSLRRLNQAIDKVEQFYEANAPKENDIAANSLILDLLLELTESEYGYIGYHDISEETGRPFLQTVVISDISWNDEIRARYRNPVGGNISLKFTDLNSLYGAVIRTGEPVISNDPAHDPRSSGRADKDHPPINCYLGLPIRVGTEVIGSAGVANRIGGYDQEMVEYVAPFLSLCANQIVIAKLDHNTSMLQEEADAREKLNREIIWISALADKLRLEADMYKVCKIVNDGKYEILSPMISVAITLLIQPRKKPIFVCRGDISEEVDYSHLIDLIQPDETIQCPTDSIPKFLNWSPSTRYIVKHEVIGGCEVDPPIHLFVVVGFPDDKSFEKGKAVGLSDELHTKLVNTIAQNYLTETTNMHQSEKKAAEKASKLKSEFLATMSHEIRTPLNGILGIMDILSESEASEFQHGLIKSVLHSSELLSTVLSDILDLSKLEGHNLRLEMTECSIRSIFESIALLFDYKASSKGLGLHFTINPSVPDEMMSDKIRVSQILSNLLSNAIKFTEKGSVSVFVDYDKSSNLVVVDVRDTGSGISPEQQDLLFKSFRRAEGFTTRKYGGTGLGLVISRKLAELLEGNLVLLWTKTGVGSTFRFTFPYIPIPEPAKDESPTPHANLADLDILIAEDNAINQKLLKMLLKKMGVENATLVYNGARALEEAISHAYDLILMDLHMPIMDGFQSSIEILGHYRSIAKKPPVIVAVTADAFAETKERCKAIGFSGFISKPFRKATFVQEVTAVADSIEGCHE